MIEGQRFESGNQDTMANVRSAEAVTKVEAEAPLQPWQEALAPTVAKLTAYEQYCLTIDYVPVKWGMVDYARKVAKELSTASSGDLQALYRRISQKRQEFVDYKETIEPYLHKVAQTLIHLYDEVLSVLDQHIPNEELSAIEEITEVWNMSEVIQELQEFARMYSQPTAGADTRSLSILATMWEREFSTLPDAVSADELGQVIQALLDEDREGLREPSQQLAMILFKGRTS